MKIKNFLLTIILSGLLASIYNLINDKAFSTNIALGFVRGFLITAIAFGFIFFLGKNLKQKYMTSNLFVFAGFSSFIAGIFRLSITPIEILSNFYMFLFGMQFLMVFVATITIGLIYGYKE